MNGGKIRSILLISSYNYKFIGCKSIDIVSILKMLRQIVAIMLVSFGASLLDLGFLRRYSKPLHNFQTITSARSAQSVRNMKLYQENSWQSREGSPRSEIPTRYDTCLVIADGIIGMEPKDMYLKNGHHVVNFPVRVFRVYLVFLYHLISLYYTAGFYWPFSCRSRVGAFQTH